LIHLQPLLLINIFFVILLYAFKGKQGSKKGLQKDGSNLVTHSSLSLAIFVTFLFSNIVVY